MPVTPFHLGPGLVLKAVAPGWFSLGAFAAVQFAIDVETVGNVVLGRSPLHGTLHSLAGATAVGIVVAALARSLSPPIARLAGGLLSRVEGYPPSLLPTCSPPSWVALAVGALTGAASHVALDAVIHDDVRLLGTANPLFIPGSFVLVHVLCVAAGALGAAGWAARVRVPRPRPARRDDVRDWWRGRIDWHVP